MLTPEGIQPLPDDDTVPIRVSDTVVRGATHPIYPVIQYRHIQGGGDAIAGGFVYRGTRVPALRGKLIFGDITTGRIWYADDGNPATLAQTHEIDIDLRRIVEASYRARGGRGDTLPGSAGISGRGRVDLRFAMDHDGELYILTKSDGVIRQVVGAR
jgi:hypothetical protein